MVRSFIVLILRLRADTELRGRDVLRGIRKDITDKEEEPYGRNE